MPVQALAAIEKSGLGCVSDIRKSPFHNPLPYVPANITELEEHRVSYTISKSLTSVLIGSPVL